MSIFEKIFCCKKKELPIVDYSLINTDIHSHLIPGIDDGSKSLEESIDLIGKLKDLGYKRIITTPHVMADGYNNSKEIILSGYEKLKNALVEANVDIKIEVSAEYNFDYGFEKLIENDEIIPFAGNYVLIELSYVNMPNNFENIIFKLITKGFKPVLAHPERYLYWANNIDIFRELKNKGLLLQLNINSLSNFYSHVVKETAKKLVDAELIDFIGSDCHGERHIDMMKTLINNEYLYRLSISPFLRNNKI